jgi:cyclophilin family peptidyl-prolyl cis-trans isomerase/HEAT repeat protein
MRLWVMAVTCGVALAAGVARAQTRMAPADLLTDLSDDGSLVQGLASEDAHVRLVAARGLSRLLEPAAASAALLERARTETDPQVLVAMAFALGQRRHAPAGEWLTGLLDLTTGHPEPAVRAAACDALGRLLDDAATSALVLRLGDNDPAVRGAAALGLFALDGRRFTHQRRADEAMLSKRDAALADAALHDPDAGVRWRAVYTLAGLRGRGGMATGLALAMQDTEPLVRVFALRGLAALQREQLAAPFDPRPFLADPDERVVMEAALAAPTLGTPAELLQPLVALLRERDNGVLRTCAAEALGRLLATSGLDPAARRDASDALADIARDDPSPMVRRAAAAACVLGADEGRALYWLRALAHGADRRDRERAATLLKDGPWRDAELLAALRADDETSVAGAALATMLARDAAGAPLYVVPQDALVESLLSALDSDDPGLRASAAEAILPQAQEGTVDPRLLHACAVALLSSTGPEMKEAAQQLRRALGLPPEGAPPAAPPPGRVLDRLLAQDAEAQKDPLPRIRLQTTRGPLLLELDRVTAPVHVAAFLGLADAGCYDGLDFHRVVPNFVAQGLDPRGDGYGTGGRRLPDEFSREPFLAGSLGMPNAGEPHTGGCQIFLTQVPTPHLDGHYTLFGRVIIGIEVLQRLEIGDRVTRTARE